ncbi:MAG: cytochrome c maturation protein CcmE [Janthinobacterium lividum]
MKKSHIFLLVVIAAAVGIIMTTMADASTYSTFSIARQMAATGNPAKVHVVGTLPRDEAKRPVGLEYDPLVNPNLFAFTLVDTLHVAQRVVYRNPKPQDMDKSEQVVIVGAMKDGVFEADQILTKCPSKYIEKDLGKTGPPATAMRTQSK